MSEINAKKRKKKSGGGKIDITFLAFILILLTVGLVMLFSASYAYSLEYYNNSYMFITRQALFAGVGVVGMLIVSRIDYHFWRKFAWFAFALTVGLLIFLLIMPPMVDGMDVKRWVVIGSFNFQPSELAKFSIILLFSSLIAANYKMMKNWKFIVFLAGLLLGTCFLIVLEPHLSATVLVLAIGAVLLVVGGLPKIYMGARTSQ